MLCYSNAIASLPGVVADPYLDYLALAVAAAGVPCGSRFAAGWAVARPVGAGGSQRRSPVFGLGMTNEGTGLELAGAALSGVPASTRPSWRTT